MKFSISKLEIFPPLQQVVGVVERKQTHEVMNNLLVEIEPEYLQLTGTDNEVELRTRIPMISSESGKTTIPARKLFDICRSLTDDARLDFEIDGDKAKIKCGKSRFTLATLPVEEFPIIDELADAIEVSVPQNQLELAIKRTAFAMAQQDVRYYLNGLLLQISEGELCCVSTDGHRLALHRTPADVETPEAVSSIIPRKAINELGRLIGADDSRINLKLTANHMQVSLGSLQMTSKLIDGKFPDFESVIPLDSNNNNPRHEEAEDELEIEYTGDPIEIGFNVVYLLDALNAIDSETAELNLRDNTSSMVIHPGDSKQSTYVVMPMKL